MDMLAPSLQRKLTVDSQQGNALVLSCTNDVLEKTTEYLKGGSERKLNSEVLRQQYFSTKLEDYAYGPT